MNFKKMNHKRVGCAERTMTDQQETDFYFKLHCGGAWNAPYKIWAMRKQWAKATLLTIMMCLTLTVAQGSISGTVIASEVNGLVVIACYADAEQGCNEALSHATPITASGTSARYSVDNLSAGQYIVFLWRDTNASGELEEDQDEIAYYAVPGEEVSLVSPPTQNINLALDNSASNPLTTPSNTTPSNTATNPLTNNQNNLEPSIFGSWSTNSYFGDYVDANTGAYLADSQSAHGVTFNTDGTYQMLDYYNLNGNCQWFKYSGTYQVKGDKIVAQPQQSELSECGAAFTEMENQTQEFLWRFEPYDDGMKFELLSVSSYRDERDWFYANRYSRVEP